MTTIPDEVAHLRVWLVPSATDAAPLTARIHELAERHGSPTFEPHLTVTPGFDRNQREAASMLGVLAHHLPIRAEFVGLGLENIIWQALYLRAEFTRELQALHEDAEALLHISPTLYLPHLSLMYTDRPLAERASIASGLGVRLPLSATFDRLQLWRTGRGGLESVPKWTLLQEWGG